MAHDGGMQMTQTPVLEGLLSLTAEALPPVEALLERATEAVRARVSDGGKVSATLIESNQTAAHGLSWLATYAEALRQMQGWAERLQEDGKFGEVEKLILQIAFGEYLSQISGGIPMSQGEFVRLQDLGISAEDQRLVNSEAGTRLM